MWSIDDGIITLSLPDGSKYYPSAAEILDNLDKDGFPYENAVYPSLSELPIRFSKLIVPASISFFIEGGISISLDVKKDGNITHVPTVENKHLDYAIVNGVWKYIGEVAESVNSILNENHIPVSNMDYRQYALVSRELNKLKIPYNDAVRESVSLIRESKTFEQPKGLNAELYPYQKGGSRWIDFMIRHKCGCILGDEMGLGKTLQVISVMGLHKERKSDSHFLVICPISLLENWRREIIKFYPGLSVLIHYGPNRSGDFNVLMNYDVVIMPYSSAISDQGLLSMITWDILVIDEAQNIKNPHAKRTKAIKNINCSVPIAVTGTPFENHMTDVWSLMDYVMPGFLGRLSKFEDNYSDDMESAEELEKIISPFIIRRMVKEVAKDLPDRIDIPQPIVMSDSEARLYEDSRHAEIPHDELKSMKLAKIQILRTFCTHPYVYDSVYSAEDPTVISTKFTRLCEILEEIFNSNEKAIIFTSFRKMIDLICQYVRQRFGIYTNFIDGTVPANERQGIVDEFSAHEGPGILVLNPKAAGAGLNITCANHVIHYNLEWNPAVEDQASARAYRRGQDKTVFVHRLYYVNTIEEIINEKIQNKRMISDAAIVGNNGAVTDEEYLAKALNMSPLTR